MWLKNKYFLLSKAWIMCRKGYKGMVLHVMVDGNIIVLLIATFWECSAKVIEKLYDVKMEG